MAHEQTPEKLPKEALRNDHYLVGSLALSMTLLWLMFPVAKLLGFQSGLWKGLAIAHFLLLLFAAFHALDLIRKLFLSSRALQRFLLAAPLLFFLAASLLSIFLPVTARDALVHHLALPKWWLELGSVVPIWWHEWSFYPALIHQGYLALRVFGFESLSAFYHGSYLFFLAACLLSFTLLVFQSSVRASFIFGMTLLLPIFLRLAGEPLVDLPLALFATLTFLSLVRYAEYEQLPHLFYSALFLALALCAKYNALLFVFIFLPLAFAYLWRTRSFLQSLKSQCVYILIAAILLTPLFFQNFGLTGNPVFPLFSSFFGSVPPGAEFLKSMPALVKHQALYGSSEWDIILLPFRMLLGGEDHSPAGFDGVGSPFLLFAYGSLFFLRSRKWFAPALLLLFIYSVAFPAFSSPRIRYLAPVLGIALLLSTAVLGRLNDAFASQKKFPRNILALVVVIQLFLTAYYLTGRLSYLQARDFLSGRLERSSYLSRYLPDYPLTEIVNRRLDDQVLVYLLFTGNRFYYYDRKVRSAGYRSERELLLWLEESRSPEELAKKIASQGITHFLYNHERMQSTLNLALRDDKKQLWMDFQSKYLRFVDGKRGHALFSFNYEKSEQLEDAGEGS